MRRHHLALPATLAAVAAVLAWGCGQSKAPANAGAQANAAAAVAAESAKAAPAEKGDMSKLETFELRIQQYADRIALAADRGEGMGIVYNSMNAIGTCLKGGEKEIELLKKDAVPADAQKLATIEKNHQAAQAAYEKLGAELKKDPISRAGVINASYALSDAAVLALGQTPKKHPVVKTASEGTKATEEKAAPEAK